MSLLEICNLSTHFKTPHGTVQAVDDVSLDVDSGDVLGIVGESGCGKSVLSLSILQLLPMPPAFFAGGQIIFEGRNLLHQLVLSLQLRDLQARHAHSVHWVPGQGVQAAVLPCGAKERLASPGAHRERAGMDGSGVTGAGVLRQVWSDCVQG